MQVAVDHRFEYGSELKVMKWLELDETDSRAERTGRLPRAW